MLKYKDIVADAWEFTQQNKKMAIWYGAIPAFLTTSVGIGYVIYQYYAFISSKLFQHWPKSFLNVVFTTLVDYLQNHRYLIIPLLVFIIIGALAYLFVPTFCQGGLIQLIARRKNGQIVRTRQGLKYGMMTFLPLFEYSLFVRTFSIASVFSIAASSVRNFGLGAFGLLLPIFIVVLLAGLVLALFFTYAEFFVVIDNNGVMTSIAKSAKLVTLHLEETLLMSVLMLIIGLRIIIQILFVFLIPAAAAGIFYLITLANLPTLAFIVGALIGVIGVALAAYLSGLVHVFAVTVWTFSFLRLTSMDVINARGEKEKKDDGDKDKK